jgi:hypothetical protein
VKVRLSQDIESLLGSKKSFVRSEREPVGVGQLSAIVSAPRGPISNLLADWDSP